MKTQQKYCTGTEWMIIDKEPYYVHYICFDDTMVTAWLEMNILTVQLFMML